ncbi:MAG: serine/threonine-protein kinase [Planctomycetota bacterium]
MEGQLLGPYRILSELGSGGMGKVYLARRSAEGAEAAPDRVAVKVVHPHLLESEGFLQRFLREAEYGRRVDHRNVVRTLAVATAEHEGLEIHYMVMEYVEGRSLRQLLRDLGAVPEAFLREITIQVADGLAAIHAAGLVHRDIKPENVLITDDQHVRIMDLGVAKLQEVSVALTSAGHFVGSLLYSAPEQFRSQEVGPPADLYSLGVTLYELATGDNPFRRDDPAGCTPRCRRSSRRWWERFWPSMPGSASPRRSACGASSTRASGPPGGPHGKRRCASIGPRSG